MPRVARLDHVRALSSRVQPRDPIAAHMSGPCPLAFGVFLEMHLAMPAVELRSLRDGVDALLMTGACRPAGLAFLRGAREGWGAADLARWLVGPYREATSLVPRAAVDEHADESLEPPPVRRAPPLRVREILLAAQ